MDRLEAAVERIRPLVLRLERALTLLLDPLDRPPLVPERPVEDAPERSHVAGP